MFEISNEIYKTIEATYPGKSADITLHRIYGLDIPFSSKWRNIGLNLSGGADSACLAMLLGKIIKENNYDCKIHTITFLRCWNTRPWQEPIGNEVYNALKDMYPGIIVSRHENYIPPELEWGVSGPIINGRSGDQIEGSSFNDYISHKLKFDAVFNATSKNPSGPGFENRLLKRDKNPEDGTLKDLMFINNNTYIIHPFRFVQKDWILAQYHLHGVVDLLNTTRSCEGDLNDKEIKELFPTLDDYEYKKGAYLPQCGHCFWCLERNWATDKIEETIAKLNE